MLRIFGKCVKNRTSFELLRKSGKFACNDHVLPGINFLMIDIVPSRTTLFTSYILGTPLAGETINLKILEDAGNILAVS